MGTSASRCCVIDFDDLCDNVTHEIDQLVRIHDEHAGVKVTLFTIPQRTSDVTIRKFKDLGDWVQLAPHGWRHTRGECLAWSDEEATAKIKAARDRGIDAPCFRAPGWLVDADVFAACKDLGYTMCTHETFRVPDTGALEYVYNLPTNRIKGVHGHLTPVSGNHISEVTIPTKCKGFKFPQEVACVY
jgi:predicted deacetylase